MTKHCWPALGLAALVGIAGAAKHATAADQAADRPQQAEATPAQSAPDELFDLTRIHAFHLDMSAAEWDKMQAVVGRGPMGGFGPGRPGSPPPENRSAEQRPAENAPAEEPPIERHKSAGFGMEFPWARASLTADCKTLDNVGVRYKGNGSYGSTAGSLKRNLKIELDHYQADARLQGAKTLNLNAGGADPTRLREAMAFEIFRAAGVPAPRTAFVELTLTVPGKYDRELVGLYTLIEQVDKAFLRDRFHDAHGLLMKPERLRGFAYLGDDWDQYAGRYNPRHAASKKQARRVIEFVRLVDKADDAKFRSEIENYLDVNEFLSYLAAGAWLANMDSLFLVGHNFYMYLNPESNQIEFIPWDLDLSFAGFPMAGSTDELLNLNLKHPHAGANKLIDRLLATPEIARRYDAILQRLPAAAVAKDRLLSQLEALENATREVREREAAAVAARNEKRRGGPFGGGPPGGAAPGGGPPGGGRFGRSVSLATFIEQRSEHVGAQLTGKDPGYTPRGGFGFGGASRFGPGNFMAGPLLAALDSNHDGKLTKDELVEGTAKFFSECDSSQLGKLDERALADGLARVVPGPPGLGPPPPVDKADAPPALVAARPEAPTAGSDTTSPDKVEVAADSSRIPRDGTPPRPAPAKALAAVLLKRADADHDGQITPDEAAAAAAAWFAEADADKKAELDEQKLAAAINLLFPRPPGFGPFGGGPPGFGPPGGRPGFGRRNAEPQAPRAEGTQP